MNRTIMSQVSAVELVAQWIEAQGRAPTRRDCREANGLPHSTTLQYVCGGVTAAVALAYAFLACENAALSAFEPSGVSACLCSVRMANCLRCSRQIVWEGPHVRLCDACRKHPAEGSAEPESVRWAGMRGIWTGEDIEDQVDWSGI